MPVVTIAEAAKNSIAVRSDAANNVGEALLLRKRRTKVKTLLRGAGVAQPLLRRWDEQRPLPVRLIRIRPERPLSPLEKAPSYLATGPVEEPFDFCGQMRQLAADIVARCAVLGQIDMRRLLLGVTAARNNRIHGLQARVTPLRFAQGELTRRRRGATYQVQRYYHGEHEFLYLMTFCLPRFLDQDFSDKLITLFHELYHIHPACNGDLRRHQGRYAIHSRSQHHYDRHMADLARAYLCADPDPNLHSFLRLNFAQLQDRHGAVAGTVVPRPKIIPVEW
jgi:hypothetical protein